MKGSFMEYIMEQMTQMTIGEAILEKRAVIVPTGATEAHGPHMPTDTDTHQAGYIALELAKRINALVAPTISYGISKTFEFFPGTISLSIPTYQKMLFEIGSSLIKQGFEHIIFLNGNRPSGTANDQVARDLIDELDNNFNFKVSAVSYWEPASEKINKMRKSKIGGMGHAGELETSFQLATRPELVKMELLKNTKYGPVAWDLVAKTGPTRTYSRRPRPEVGHAAIFGDPSVASKEMGKKSIKIIVSELEKVFKNLRPSYEEIN